MKDKNDDKVVVAPRGREKEMRFVEALSPMANQKSPAFCSGMLHI